METPRYRPARRIVRLGFFEFGRRVRRPGLVTTGPRRSRSTAATGTTAAQHRGLRPHRRQPVPGRRRESALDLLDRRRHGLVHQRAAVPTAARPAAAAGRRADRGAGQLLPLRLSAARQDDEPFAVTIEVAELPVEAGASAGAHRPQGPRDRPATSGRQRTWCS